MELLDLHKRMLRLFEGNKMIRIYFYTQQTHFIGCWNLENKDLCNNIIKFFENNTLEDILFKEVKNKSEELQQ